MKIFTKVSINIKYNLKKNKYKILINFMKFKKKR